MDSIGKDSIVYNEKDQEYQAPPLNIDSNPAKTFSIKHKGKIYKLELSILGDKITLKIQEKFSLFFYEKTIAFSEFSSLHKYFKFFDTAEEILANLIKISRG